MSILDQIFEMALKTNEESVPDSPFAFPMLRWLQANSDMKTRNALLEFLLHPHVRSYRCRAALGQRNQQLIFDILESYPLTQCGKAVPNVVGTYLLHGVRTDEQDKSQDESQDLVYIGQSAAVKPSDTGALGLRLRSQQHWYEISKVRTGAPSKSALHVHRRLSNAEIERVEFVVLSVFPFPKAEMGNTLRHFVCLLTLVETVDIVLIGSLSMPEAGGSTLYTGSQHGVSLRPSWLPSRACEGLNRALPIKQHNKLLGTSVVSTCWSPQDVVSLISLVERHERDIYVHVGSNQGVIQWDFLVAQLRVQGVHKTKAEAMAMYAQLVRNPESGFISCRASRWRLIWAQVHRVKEHLHQSGLIHGPRDDNDLFYHIPTLENGLKTSWHFRGLLQHSGYTEYNHPIFLESFFPRYLPRLLHRDVWEKITGNIPLPKTPECSILTTKESPPERLSAKRQGSSRYLNERTIEVVLHYARHIFVEQGVDLASPISTNPSIPSLSWQNLIQLWHRVYSQMLADGVPPERILVGGLVRLADVWNRCRNCLLDPRRSEPLQRWKYELSLDGLQEKPMVRQSSSLSHSGDQQDQMDTLVQDKGISEVSLEEPYEWPSEVSRYEALASTNEVLALMGTHTIHKPHRVLKLGRNRSSPCELAQHRPSTLRVLTHIMRNYHQIIFDNDFEVSADIDFWETLFIGGLDKSWKIPDQHRLRQRFGWVLEFIRTGCLPPDAHTANDILREGLADNVLLCQTHPYSYQSKHPTDTLLNPDLCPRWVEELLSATGALRSVEMGIRGRMHGIGIKGFCDMYGILISRLWEESMYQPSHRYQDFDQTHSGGEVLAPCEDSDLTNTASLPRVPSPLSLGLETRVSNRQMTLDNLNYEDDEPFRMNDLQAPAATSIFTQPLPLTAPKPPDSSGSPSPPLSPPPHSPLRGDTTKHLRRWDPKEDDYLGYVMKLDLARDTKIEKFQARFGPHRTKASLAGRMRHLRKDQLAMRKITKWDPEEREHLEILLQAGMNWEDISKAMEARFAKNRLTSAYRSYAHTHELDTSGVVATSHPWTDEQDDYLKVLCGNQTPLEEYPKFFREKFGIERSRKAFKARCGIKRFVGSEKGNEWAQDQLDLVWDCVCLGLTRSEVCDKFWKRFGTGRSERALATMATKMKATGGIPEKTREHWTIEEEQFLRDWPDPTQRGLVAAFHARFGTARSVFAVQGKFALVRNRSSKD